MEALGRLVAFVQIWQPVEPHAVSTFLKDIALTFSFYNIDESLYPLQRTTNALERLFREFRAKTDKIGAYCHALLPGGFTLSHGRGYGASFTMHWFY